MKKIALTMLPVALTLTLLEKRVAKLLILSLTISWRGEVCVRTRQFLSGATL